MVVIPFVPPGKGCGGRDTDGTVPGQGRPHAVDDMGCWCKPRIVQSCLECFDEDSTRADCWLCSGEGWVAMTNDFQPIVIIHNDRDGEETRHGVTEAGP